MKPNSILQLSKRFLLLLIPALCLLLPLRVSACRLVINPKSTPLESVAGASNQFGFQLYQKMAAQKPAANQFMSPFSVWAALSMTSEGAAGSTLELLSKALGLPEAAVLHAGLAELSQALSRADAPYALAVANAIWPEKTAQLNPEFVATIKKAYHGESVPLDFAQKSEESRLKINAWVEQQTNKRIKNLIPAGAVGSDTRMVLTNAIFFKGKWKLEFDKKLTQELPFYLQDGSDASVQAPLMYRPAAEDKLRYVEMDGFQALQLPYKGDDLSMVVLLPGSGPMSKMEKELSADSWAEISNAMRYQQVNVWLPRFKMELGGSIKPSLEAMGLGGLFAEADFSRMFLGGGSFAVSDVIHKAFVEVNEEGTEAAAATAVIVRETSAIIEDPAPIMNFRADHPFIFMIQHNASRSILFMGKVMKPN